jgi:hypothetical protein
VSVSHSVGVRVLLRVLSRNDQGKARVSQGQGQG